jgi:hypothetical protein
MRPDFFAQHQDENKKRVFLGQVNLNALHTHPNLCFSLLAQPHLPRVGMIYFFLCAQPAAPAKLLYDPLAVDSALLRRRYIAGYVSGSLLDPGASRECALMPFEELSLSLDTLRRLEMVSRRALLPLCFPSRPIELSMFGYEHHLSEPITYDLSSAQHMPPPTHTLLLQLSTGVLRPAHAEASVRRTAMNLPVGDHAILYFVLRKAEWEHQQQQQQKQDKQLDSSPAPPAPESKQSVPQSTTAIASGAASAAAEHTRAAVWSDFVDGILQDGW